MPPNVFGAGIEELRRLETFVNEVSSYRRAVSELNELSRTMHMDPALVSTGGGGGGERNGERSGGGDGEDSGSGNELDGSEIFRAISEEDITFVTTGGILDLKSIDDKKYRTRYCWVRALFSQHIMCYVVILTRSILVLFLEFILILILILIFILVLALLLLLHFLLHYFFYLLIFSCRYLKH